MLQAITRNKARMFLKHDGTRIPREDLMTDVVFGGLSYFSPEEGGTALHWLMPEVVDFGSSIYEVRLWPRSQGIEPDVVIDFFAPDGSRRRLIVECKWEDFLLTAKQLSQQWTAFGPSTVDADVHHVLVVQRKSRVEPEAFLSAHSEVRKVRTLFLWRDLAAAANVRLVSQGSPHLDRWVRDVVRVVDAADERAFSGWRAAPEVDGSAHFMFSAAFWDDPNLKHDIDISLVQDGWKI